jgi:hypothetical protein
MSFVQDDIEAFQKLDQGFSISFAHNQTRFLNWSIIKPEEDTEHTATWQTDF